MTYAEKKEELEEKERQLELLKAKIGRGEIGGLGAPQLIQDLTAEIIKLKIELYGGR